MKAVPCSPGRYEKDCNFTAHIIHFNTCGWLPIAANFEYSVAMFELNDNPRGLKISFIINMLMFSVFCFGIKNYVGCVANIVVAVTTFISLIKESKDRQNNKK